ncbi:MAG: GerW family sporulation protein [Butyrivibrio sp.]|nr:GerW family sporulation protein [Butyrivibrio sp.]
MAESNFGVVMESLMKGMNGMLSSKTVVGEATKVGDTIILPLVDVSFGVGAGSGTGDKKESGAGGFGAKMSPSAVLVIKNGSTKLVNIKNQDAVTKVLDLVPDIVDKFSNRNKDMMADDEAVDIAFPDKEEE